MRAEIQRLQHSLGTTTLYVTHDQTEAMTMGDRVAVMRDGRLVQVGTPQTLYDEPVDLFVAGFIGSPAMNLIRARVRAENGGVVAEAGDFSLQLPGRAVPKGAMPFVGRDVILGIRPEHLEDAGLATTNGRPTLTVPVTLAEPVGAEVIVHCELDAAPAGTMLARVDPHTRASPGGNVSLAVNPEALYFFDPETELALL
jgi:multiple sugar transport system ATP-binding protein